VRQLSAIELREPTSNDPELLIERSAEELVREWYLGFQAMEYSEACSPCVRVIIAPFPELLEDLHSLRDPVGKRRRWVCYGGKRAVEYWLGGVNVFKDCQSAQTAIAVRIDDSSIEKRGLKVGRSAGAWIELALVSEISIEGSGENLSIEEGHSTGAMDDEYERETCAASRVRLLPLVADLVSDWLRRIGDADWARKMILLDASDLADHCLVDLEVRDCPQNLRLSNP